ncbi:hypothetical protein [Maribacter aestuarii]|uniref:hypothetical protein n=1 Tax=Maribacter aestuarii TaxID=1130723 RepID=UPI00248CE847|nr:hypothetical protein [Maribacter aestuarii]
MTTETRIKPPAWFWVVSVLALLWNLSGVVAYLAQAFMTPEDIGKMPEAERLLIESQPVWVTGAFALAVWGGALGSVALLLRKKWAVPILIISLVGILGQMSYAFFMSNSFEVYGPGAMVMPIVVIVIGIALVFFARKASAEQWLN